jgi:RNA polymerase sigma-70 factor (ECF subfamily)
MLDQQSPNDSTTDRELINRTVAGDRRAFEQLVERHAAAVLRLATVVTGDGASGEDVLQQTFLAAYRNASSFRAEASVRTWLLTITRNAAFRVQTKRSREDLMEEPLMNLGLGAGWGGDNPEALAIAAEDRDLLRRAMRTLSASDQEVLVLRDMEGLRAAEVAEVLGIGERAVKSRLHRARLRLAAALHETATTRVAGGKGGAS